MNAIFYLLFLLFLLPCHSQQVEINSLNPAAKVVYIEILRLEELLNASKDSTITEMRGVGMLNNLSGHSAKDINANYLGIVYEINIEDIKCWKNWFYKNKDNFSYYTDNDIFPDLSKGIIKIEYEPGLFRYSEYADTLNSYREFSKKG